MAEEIDCANLGLPADFFTEDFFAEKKSCEGGGNPYDWVWHTHTGPNAGEDYLAKLTCKMAHYFLLDDEGDRMPSTKVLLVNASSPLSSLLFLHLGALTWVVLNPSTSLAKHRRGNPSLFPSAIDDKKDNFSSRSAGDSCLFHKQTKKAQLSAAR